MSTKSTSTNIHNMSVKGDDGKTYPLFHQFIAERKWDDKCQITFHRHRIENDIALYLL